MSTYPSATTIPTGTVATPVDSTEWNRFVDNLNEIIEDLILGHGDGQAFPGTDHTAGQSICIDDGMQAIRHQVAHALGETHWYDAPAGSLKQHTHAVGQGGLVPWGSLGVSNARKIELHPQYSGAVQTTSLRGAGASGNNAITVTNINDIVSYVDHHCYSGISSVASLNDTYIAVSFTLPKDFTAWAASNAIQIEFKTDSALSADCHVDVYIYKSGNGTVVTNTDNSVNVNWSNITIDDSVLGAWSADDIMEIYLKLESKNSNAVKIGKIALNYTS